MYVELKHNDEKDASTHMLQSMIVLDEHLPWQVLVWFQSKH
jgi:hypothetical protein